MLAMTRDSFLRHAITEGRQGTAMIAFGAKFTEADIDNLVSYLRSRASGWEVKKPVLQTPPEASDYVIKPRAENADFKLKDEKYVLSKDLYAAIEKGKRLVILDTRVISLWQMAHIKGSIPLPYYYSISEYGKLFKELPNDGTWIISYCECPRAAAESVNKKLRDYGFKNTAVLWEGAFGWVAKGFPFERGEVID